MELINRAISKPDFKITDNRRLTFYAALYDTPTVITERQNGKLVTYTEVIKRGAFSEALKASPEIVANIDHKGESFAKRSTGELLIQDDPKGLFVSTWIPESEMGNLVKRRVEQGELDGASFRAFVKSSRHTDGVIERVEFDTLEDVCLTSNPAYEDTRGEVMLRHTTHIENQVRFLLQKYRLIKLLGD